MLLLGQVPRRLAMAMSRPMRARGLSSAEREAAAPARNSPLLLLVPLVTFGLGTWQVQRKEQKEALLAFLASRLQGEPRSLPDDLTDVAAVEYCRVRVRGVFQHDREVLVGPRTLARDAFNGEASEAGFHVVTPLVLGADAGQHAGKTVLVNRGWVPSNCRSPAGREAGQVAGSVDVDAIVRTNAAKQGTFVPNNNPAAGDWHWTDVPALASWLHCEPVLLDIAAGSAPPGGLPVPGQTQINIRNEHMQYILTWYSLTAATLAMWLFVKPGNLQGPSKLVRRLPHIQHH